MSDFILVGQARRDAPAGIRQFETMHDYLLGLNEPEVEAGLEKGLLASAALYCLNFEQHMTSNERMHLILDHTVKSIGKEQLEIAQGVSVPQWGGLGWLRIARSELDVARACDPEREAEIKSSVFYSGNREMLTALSKFALKSIVPWGAYKRYAFAAGVATGKIEALPDLAQADNE
jgi:hypothetical protein